MPKKDTQPVTTHESPTAWAQGLHDSKRNKPYLFSAFQQSLIRIGRRRSYEIHVDHGSVSHLHALIEYKDGRGILHDCDTTNHTYVDGQVIKNPVTLVVGMVIRFGQATFIATDEHGEFPMSVYNIGELCHTAHHYYGTSRAAGKHIGASHTYVCERGSAWKREQLYGRHDDEVQSESSH